MVNGTLIRKRLMECPLCDRVHEVEEGIRTTSTTIKGEVVSYQERFYYCTNSTEEECEFETGTMTNENLLSARNAYRKKHGLLTSEEIVDIRENYGMTQVELAKLLGWGEATISRYESKAIQDEAYDNMLRIIKDNPWKAIEFLDKNKEKFSTTKRRDIRLNMIQRLESYGREFLVRQTFNSEYARYLEPSDVNGYKKVDIDKIERIISYYAKSIPRLYKAKLMRMLWYTDAIFFKSHGESMTGLVYLHENKGALPVGHSSLLNLENIKYREEEIDDSVRLYFYPNEAFNDYVFLQNELIVLEDVVRKFENYNLAEIVDYMNEEQAYKKTKVGEIIPYSLAKEVRAF